ncbi:hypothetical protein [Calothrix sp. CCY 0018]|uniref:hypothetical protein n=1 Tax=Calothrix sp. CCY 0018 TaxID=3103864 RepID=UPI0039C5DA3F
MNQENQEPKQADTNKQNEDDSSRSPGVDRVDRDSPGVDRGLKSSENASEKNQESNKDSEKK